MTINGNTLTVVPQDTRPQPEGYSLNGWTAEAKKKYLDDWHAAHPQAISAFATHRNLLRPAGI